MSRESALSTIVIFGEQILAHIEKSNTGDDFLKQLSLKSFEQLLSAINFGFLKINEIAYNYLEENTVPDPRLNVLAFIIAAIGHKTNLFGNLTVDHPLNFYFEVGKGNLDEKIAKGILINQALIDDYNRKLVSAWSYANDRGIFTKGSSEEEEAA